MIQEEGSGWRLSRDPSRPPFSVLIGGEDWALELKECEACELVSLISDLTDQHRAICAQLMAEESITVELERGSWWVCLEGDRSRWSIRAICSGDGDLARGFEVCWPDPAAQAIAEAMRTLWDNGND
ncbi:DUF1818 family protein [Synechococcus sp. UW179A]|uniref:DUF1818 family protein n=1 Tax=Synechococcus sp. UW179A TaxID=2575510 RepID=UPI000E0EAB36|nr:DUF1818 family protein [Synechococcus sp. UW179A]